MAEVESTVRRLPVMADVARAAGVSQKTVSRVVNDAPHVRESVRQQVNDAIRTLGYRPNSAARALVTQRTRVIGIVSTGADLYGPAAQMTSLERAAWRAGYAAVIVSTAHGTRDELRTAISRLLEHGVDGIAVGAPWNHADGSIDLGADVPLIAVGDPAPTLEGFAVVACDQRSGARAATEHLLGLGHRTVWHVAGPASWYSAQDRRLGWADALAAAGAPVPEIIPGDWTPESGYRAGQQLAANPAATAVFVANDHMAAGVMRALHESGRAIPREVSVVGFDDTPEAAYHMVPLTTLRQDFARLAEHAVEQLVAAMTTEQAPQSVNIPVDLVVRASSGPAPPTPPQPEPPKRPLVREPSGTTTP